MVFAAKLHIFRRMGKVTTSFFGLLCIFLSKSEQKRWTKYAKRLSLQTVNINNSLLRILFAATWICASNHMMNARTTKWLIAAESPQTRVMMRGDTIDITTPAGLTLWYNKLLTAPCTIHYRACVVVGNGATDRLSDLNCFWMANTMLPEGRFVDNYRLRCYYLGYGGNHNTTTRFRRYTADSMAVNDIAHRPPVLVEYTDSTHLLLPNHWYDIHITVASDGHTTYTIDGETLVDYHDPTPLRQGYFGLRTTWSHIRMTGFTVTSAH